MNAASGSVARLLEPVIVPAVFDFWAQKLNRTLSWERCLARVVERHREARDTVTLVLRANRHFPGYQPGQHLNLSVEVNGVRLTRSYSPVTLPEGRQFAITVRKEPGGKVSSHLVDHARVGDVLEIGPGDAFGDMVVPGDAGKDPWLLVAGGSGITPVWCLAQALLAADAQARVHLMYWARQREDLCFQAGLSDMHARFPNFTLTTILTGEAAELPGEQSGRPRASHFASLAELLPSCRARVCGSQGFVDAIEGLLAEAVKEWRSESFSRPVAVAEPGEAVSVTLSRSGRQLQVPSGRSLLEGLEAAGLSPAYGCRRGICNTCVCHKHAGTTRNLLDGRQDREAGEVRLCISAPRSDITLDL